MYISLIGFDSKGLAFIVHPSGVGDSRHPTKHKYPYARRDFTLPKARGGITAGEYRDILQWLSAHGLQCIQHLITERDAVRRQAEAREMDATKYREQRDDVVAAMGKHNPEVIGAQEDLQDILGDAVVSGTSSTSGLPEPKLQDHVKRELSYHIALLPQPLSGGEARVRLLPPVIVRSLNT